MVFVYDFALDAKRCMRHVYTSPLNNISNQKYYDFSNTFDMGPLTCDVRFSYLIMITEIIGSMFYKGENIICDIEWVILDEVHYVNNVERGFI